MATLPDPLSQKNTARPAGPAPTEGGEASPPRAAGLVVPPALVLPLVIGLSVLCLGLLVTVGWLSTTVTARDKTIVRGQNHSEQREAATTVLQSQLSVAKGDTAKLKSAQTEATAESVQLKAQVDDSKAGAVELQSQLDKTRVTSNTFQSQMEDAKVASIRRQGEVELAKTQTTVLQAQWAQAKADTERLQLRLDDLNLRFDASQEKLKKAESELALLQKARAKN